MTNLSWIDEYIMQKDGVTKDYKAEWGWTRYMVGSKMFAALMHPSDKYNPDYAEKDLINLKSDPEMAQILRREHSGIYPGFYSDKRTWNSIDLNSGIPLELMKKMIDESYSLIFSKLTKKLQKEILSHTDIFTD